jgi:hypothetical protein
VADTGLDSRIPTCQPCQHTHTDQPCAGSESRLGAYHTQLLVCPKRSQCSVSCSVTDDCNATNLHSARLHIHLRSIHRRNATFQRYAGYVDQAREALGLSATGPLTAELVQRFRDITGTECVPPAFTPPTEVDASITGETTHERARFQAQSEEPLCCGMHKSALIMSTVLAGTGLELTLDGGSCQLSRVAIQTRKDLVARCVLPEASLEVTRARYSSAYVAPATFRGTVRLSHFRQTRSHPCPTRVSA